MDDSPIFVETPTAQVRAGLVGRGILESRTPWMHEQEGQAQGLDYRYTLLDFAARGWADNHLPRVIAAAQQQGFAGLNVTFPFKQAVIALLDELSPVAQAIGAVNTVAFRDGRRIGHNTDVTGFAASFRAGLPDVARGLVLQLGCGGAGSATAHALLGELGVGTLVLHDPDGRKAEELAAALAGTFGAGRVAVSRDLVADAARADGLLNASPMGMAKFPGMPLSATAILPRHWVADVVYFPLETELLAVARAKGCRTLDGGGMAVHQAADAFTIFTGLAADCARMTTSFGAFAPEPQP
jgi:shikimate dehydrogenase